MDSPVLHTYSVKPSPISFEAGLSSSWFTKKQQHSYDIKTNRYNLNFKSTNIKIDNNIYDLSIIKDCHSIDSDNKLNNCIYKISEASHYVNDLDELYSIIHKILNEIIYTENFYIAIADWDNNLIHFPYFVDQLDDRPASKEIGDGLTEYVCKTGESILVNPEQNDSFIKNKKMNIYRGSKRNYNNKKP
jgi:hypothetical protein